MMKSLKDVEQEIYQRVRRRAESYAMTMLLEVAKYANHPGRYRAAALDESDYCAVDVLAGYLEQAATDAAELADAFVHETYDLTTLAKMVEVSDRSFEEYLSAFRRFKRQIQLAAA